MPVGALVLAQNLAMISDSTGEVQFLLDCLVSDNHTWSSEVSEYPVESGATISDHVRNLPLRVEIEAIVSNTPIGTAREQRTVPDESTDALYDHLMKIHEDRRPVTISTSLRTYESMVLQDLAIPRDAQTGDAIRFTASFIQVKQVKNVRGPRVAIPAAKRPRRLPKPPLPVKDTKTQTKSFNETLPLVRVYRISGQYIWYDDALSGWRYGVIHDPPSGGKPSDEGWVVLKDRPYGVSHDDWYFRRKTDAQYREDISNAYEARSELNGGGGGLAPNPYDPFLDFGIGGRRPDVRIVHAIRR